MRNTVFLVEKSDNETLTQSFYEPEPGGFHYRDTLPYERLGGEGFERLCYLILLNENKRCIPHFFGRKGQKQYGADIIYQDQAGDFEVYQCKNRKDKLSASEFTKIFDKFKEWIKERNLPGPGRFILCTPLERDTFTSKAFLAAKKNFETWYQAESNQTILVEYWDRDALDNKLRKLPDIVVDMFGSDVAERHCDFVNWNSGIFIPVTESRRNNFFLREFFKREDKIYIPREWKDNFFETIRTHKKVLIKGFPGSGKTTISLALSRHLSREDRGTGKQYYVYYVNFKTRPSSEELRIGMHGRSFLPSVFIFDDCQREPEEVKAFIQSIMDVFENKGIFCIYIYRTTLVEDKKCVEDSDIEELFEESTLELEATPGMFKEIVGMVKPALKSIDIDALHKLSGHDLFILDFILQEINSQEDLEKIKADREKLYRNVLKKYFGTDADRFTSELRIAFLAQFDIGIHPGYFEDVIKGLE